METTTMTPEQLKAEAARLQQLAADAERAARDAKQQTEHDEFIAKSAAIHQTVCYALQMRLMTRGVPTTIEMYAGGWQEGMPYLAGCGVAVEVHVTTAGRYVRSYQITGVEVKVGTYGERPQTWRAARAAELPFAKIMDSILRRRALKAEEQKARALENTKYETRMAVREGNKALAATLNTAYPYYVSPSELAAGHVIVKFECSLTEVQARNLFALLQSFDKEVK